MHEKKLFQNTIFLYLLTFSTQILNFLTVPYLTRVFGPTVYGKIGMAVAYMSYAQLVLDFGFTLSATKIVSEKRNDKDYMSSIVTTVSFVKLALSVIIALVVACILKLTCFSKEDIIFYIMYMVAYIFGALLPDFFYRGIENMKTVTIRTVVIKTLSTVLVFVFVHTKADVILIPLFLLIGNVFALLFSILDLKVEYHLQVRLLPFNKIHLLIKETIPFFISRIASTFYQGLNTILMGAIYGTSEYVGYYSSADKIVSLVKAGTAPVADSLYPYMVRNRNYKLIKRLLCLIIPLIVICMVVGVLFADEICVFLFGSEYRAVGNVFRCLIPCAAVIFPSYIIAFPVMTPLGLAKYANYSNVLGMIIQVVQLGILFLIGKLNIYSICCATSVTEVSVLVFRIVIILAHLKKSNRLRKDE